MDNIRNNNITTPYEQYIGERVAPPTVSPDYSNSTPTDTNGISSPKVNNIYDVHLSYITQKLNEQENSLKDLQKKYEELLKELHHLKGKFETLEKYGFGAIGFLIIQFLILLGIFFGYINPILSIVKTNPENINNSQQVIPVDKNQ